MNYETIQKAIKNGTLRKYHLSLAQVGNRVIEPTPGVVIAIHWDKVVFGWEDGNITHFDPYDDHCIYLAPLCWVEDKPVYKGDTLYRQNGKQVAVSGLNGDGTFLLFEDGGSWATDGSIYKLSWTNPKTPITINGIDVPAPEVVAPADGTTYWCPDLPSEKGVTPVQWCNDDFDNRALARGIVHLTEAAAIKHAEALLSFTAKE